MCVFITVCVFLIHFVFFCFMFHISFPLLIFFHTNIDLPPTCALLSKTQRCFDVYLASIKRRCIDVKTTQCVIANYFSSWECKQQNVIFLFLNYQLKRYSIEKWHYFPHVTLFLFQAQKQRTRGINILKRLFKSVDCIITPGNTNKNIFDYIF